MVEQLLIYPIKNICRKKGRSILTILGVAIGVCSVIIINSIGNFGTVAVNTELDSLGMGGLTIATKNSEIPFADNELSIVRNNSDISVLECALESGYTSLRSFNRNFYMCLGLSPTEYRQTAKLV